MELPTRVSRNLQPKQRARFERKTKRRSSHRTGVKATTATTDRPRSHCHFLSTWKSANKMYAPRVIQGPSLTVVHSAQNTQLSPGSMASGLVLARSSDCFIASSFLFSLPSHHLPTLSSHPIRHHSFLSLSLPPIFAYHTRYRSRGDQRGAFAFVVRSSFRGRENPSRATQFREGVHHVDFAHFNFFHLLVHASCIMLEDVKAVNQPSQSENAGG